MAQAEREKRNRDIERKSERKSERLQKKAMFAIL
jgi:hypothetical protein